MKIKLTTAGWESRSPYCSTFVPHRVTMILALISGAVFIGLRFAPLPSLCAVLGLLLFLIVRGRLVRPRQWGP